MYDQAIDNWALWLAGGGIISTIILFTFVVFAPTSTNLQIEELPKQTQVEPKITSGRVSDTWHLSEEDKRSWDTFWSILGISCLGIVIFILIYFIKPKEKYLQKTTGSSSGYTYAQTSPRFNIIKHSHPDGDYKIYRDNRTGKEYLVTQWSNGIPMEPIQSSKEDKVNPMWELGLDILENIL